MNVKQVMTPDVIVASPEDTLAHASQVMHIHELDALPICENDRLIGMLSDLDITLLSAAKDLSMQETKIRQVMTTKARYVFEDQSTEYAAHYMEEYQVRRLLVLNRHNRLVGIVSSGDLPVFEEDPALFAYAGVFQPC
jgi:CBS domain-containing protein